MHFHTNRNAQNGGLKECEHLLFILGCLHAFVMVINNVLTSKGKMTGMLTSQFETIKEKWSILGGRF